MAVYALAYDEKDRPAGTGRLIINDESRFQIGRVCVLKEARGQGLGDLVVRMLLYRALELGAGEIWLGAQLPAVGFYARYGFHPSVRFTMTRACRIAGCGQKPKK